MTTHNLENSMFGVVPFVAIVLDGDFTDKIKEKDEIQTRLVKYRVEGCGYDEKNEVTTVMVREIVP